MIAEITIFQNMLGKTILNVTGAEKDSEEILFALNDGTVWRFHHEQYCCEQVMVEDVCGDIADLLNYPLLQAEEIIDSEPDGVNYATDETYPDQSQTWTFYKFATIKGSVTIRWLGESNGYYSESVDLEILPANLVMQKEQ